jgi:hypothetical protein
VHVVQSTLKSKENKGSPRQLKDQLNTALVPDMMSRDSAVGTAIGYGLDGLRVGVRVPVESRIFLSTSSRIVLGQTQPPIQWVPGALSPGVKHPEHETEADHSSSTSAEIKNTWIYKSISPICLHGVALN